MCLGEMHSVHGNPLASNLVLESVGTRRTLLDNFLMIYSEVCEKVSEHVWGTRLYTQCRQRDESQIYSNWNTASAARSLHLKNFPGHAEKKKKKKEKKIWSSCRGSVETNLTSNHEDTGSLPSLTQWVKDRMLLLALVWVPDTAWFWHGCGVGWQLQI